MNEIDLLNKYLSENHTMQLATLSGDQPWISTVYYISDERHNIYWASLPSRRHSLEIEAHSRVACAVVVSNIIGKPVIGLQIEGMAQKINPPIKDKSVVERYAKKFLKDQKWTHDFIAGHTKHRLYKLTPTSIYLFDELNYPGGQRQKVV